MAARETGGHGFSPTFMRKLEGARSTLRSVALLSIFGGIFALVFTLLRAVQFGLAALDAAHASFLVGGAIGFAIGLGLLNYSEAVRRAGVLWFVVWGIVEVVAGLLALLGGHTMIGVLCACGGAVMIVFAGLLYLPAQAFVCAYTAGDLSPGTVEEGILRGLDDHRDPAMADFVAGAQIEPDSPEGTPPP
jgi:hypothetical protein